MAQEGRSGPSAVLPSGHVTFLFTDMAGSTRLLHDLGVERYGAVLERHRELIRTAVFGLGGAEIKTEGDALFCAFPDARSALAACVDGQRALAQEEWPDGLTVSVRMGVHSGNAVPVAGDYIALAVHQAARISAAAHGGQVLVSDVTMNAAGSLPEGVARVDVGLHLLKDFDDPVRLWQLQGDGLADDFPPLRTRTVRLPAPRGTFVGRAGELGKLVQTLAQPGLITLIGPGGVGKTRLALEAAGELATKDASGVHFVELATEPDVEAVAQIVARQLGVSTRPGRSATEQLVDELAPRRVVLVLDNCEGTSDAAAALADQLVTSCRELTVLATSRVPLEVDGERRVQLEPLPLGTDEDLGGDAVRLFLDRVAVVTNATTFGDDDVAAAAEVCRRLDGLPLALELAASTVGVMPLPVLLDELDNRLDVLRARGRTPRQQTLRALLDWSHELLTDEGRRALRRLGLFSGSFGVDTAAAVVSAVDDVPSRPTARLLAELAAHSFISLDASNRRYHLLETVRVYAVDKLVDAHEQASVEQALLHWVHGWVSTINLSGVDAVAIIQRIKADYSLIVTAMGLAYESGRLDLLGEMCARMGRYWYLVGAHSEGIIWCARGCEEGAPVSSATAMTRATLGRLQVDGPNPDDATLNTRLAQQMAREVGDEHVEMMALLYEVMVDEAHGDYDRAEAASRAAHEYGRSHGDAQVMATALNQLGVVAYHRQRFAEAREQYLAGLAVMEESLPRDVPVAHFNLGEVELALGNHDAAIHHLRLAVETGRELEYTGPMAISLALLIEHDPDVERHADYAKELKQLRSRVGPELDQLALLAGEYDLSPRPHVTLER